MGYYIDLENISIDEYREMLKKVYLPPSRMILKEDLEGRFNQLKSLGLSNLKQLSELLKKKNIITNLQNNDCFGDNYLTILLREINSMHPKPNKIKDFKGIDSNTAICLEKIGIKDTYKLYDRVLNKESRKELAEITGLTIHTILELTKLADLSRIKWVGATFARMLYDLGVDTVEKASKADPVNLHDQINKYNKENGLYKGHIGLNDIKIFVDAAKEVPIEIEYDCPSTPPVCRTGRLRVTID
ncbi:MAG: hypothetical protein CVT98_06475 [Bacteroidetes bacterium HGW-Bacteroidetes-15]|nr:MAG: hypothetical protein CVT98_06475 [Bacteroidetes bacterium HGW-Bacteroidetes-15]